MQEHNIVAQVLAAQESSQAADDLIEQYLPFIKSETAKTLGRFPGPEDDELSIAMFAFYEAAMAYRSGRGAFLKLAAAAIKNRLIDHRRKQTRHEGHLSLDEAEEDQRPRHEQIPDHRADLDHRQDRADAREEIGQFVRELAEFGLELTDIADNCPKQARTMAACMAVLDHARQEPSLLEQLVSTKKLPLGQLAQGAGVDKKTLERHRKYIVAILLAYTNGFEIIRGHLQMLKRKEDAIS